jgi:hypothetical protein
MDTQYQNQAGRDQAIARLLSFRYGDGGIYVPRHAPESALLRDALASGFVSEDGFVTRKGRRLLAKTDF